MKKTLITYILLFFCIGIQAYTERNLLQKEAEKLSLKDVLISNQKWVTYPDYTNRNGWDQLLGNNKPYIISQGEKYLGYKWQVVQATDYLDFERTGTRTTMEKPLNENLTAISSLFLAELAEGKGRFTDQIINGVFHSCEMTSWVLSAHLVIQQSHRSMPDHNAQVIDLVSGDTGSMLSWIYYFLNKEFDKVNPIISERLKKEIQDKILEPYMDGNRFWWMALGDNWKGFVNNWNPWCNSNVLQCFLLIENDPDKLSAAVYKTMTSVDKFINYTHEDGACEEGPAYWGHAAGKMYDYLQLLSDATNGKVSIFDKPIIRNMGEYISRSYVGNEWVVNFADASAKLKLDYELIYRYGKAVNSNEMMQFAAYLKQQQPKELSISRDMYRTLSNLYSDKEIDRQQAIHNNPSQTWYSETEFCYMVNNNMFFAAKGGYNDESHNHNDIGTFSLYIDNYPVFIDAGVGTYTRKTFSSERYSIWSMQSNYHNIPIINGFPQKYGKTYKSLNAKFDSRKNTFSLDISKAYPEEANINKWVRSYKLEKKTLQIEDIFDLESAHSANQINFMTWGNVDISKEGVVYIKLDHKTVELIYDKNKFTPSVEVIQLEDKRLSDIWGDELYRISLDAKTITRKDFYKFTIKYQ
jgi:hypothetical protein